jgi:hypothetical protein
VEQSDFLPVHAEALLDLTEILCLTGQPQKALPHLEKSIRLFEQKGTTVSATKTRALLEEIRRS